jgi:glycosyltransferase involved in cell wall biosynthesis
VLLPEYEGFGLPVLEAQANSSVVVCSDIPVLREVLGKSALYVDFDFMSKDVDGLIRVLKDKNSLDQLIIAGKENVQRYSWHKTGQQTLQVYNSAMQ